MAIVDLFIPTAMAADTAAPVQDGSLAPVFLLVVIVVMMYVLIWRPQNKLKKEHQRLVSTLVVGDEVMTNGGIVGKVMAIDGAFVTLRIAADVDIQCQKTAISNALPKGSLKI